MTKDEALRLALEALYNLSHYADTCELFLKETHPGKADALRQRVTKSIEAITAIKTALEAKDEPVACGVDWGRAGDVPCVSIIKKLPDGKIEVVAVEYGPQRTWVGLTDEEVSEIRLKTFDAVATNHEVYRAIEAKLKEKNT